MRISTRRLRSWLVLLVAVGTFAVAIRTTVDALRASRKVFRSARRHAGESLELSQDRLFGAEYMASIRAVRSAIGRDQTVYFADQSDDVRWTYFALFQLAPRRLVRFGQIGDPIERATRGPNRRARLLVLVPPDDQPLELVSLGDLPARHSNRARKDRP